MKTEQLKEIAGVVFGVVQQLPACEQKTELHKLMEVLRTGLLEHGKEFEWVNAQYEAVQGELGRCARPRIYDENGEESNNHDWAVWERCAAYWYENAQRMQREIAELKQVEKVLKQMVSDVRANAETWRKERDLYVEVMAALGVRFGCGHAKNGPDDCMNFVRHVDGLLDALRKANHALAWAEPKKGGESCNGVVTESQCQTWYLEAREAIDYALATKTHGQ